MSPGESSASKVGVAFQVGGTCPRCQNPGMQLVVDGQVTRQLLCEGCQRTAEPEEPQQPEMDVGQMLSQCGVNVAGYGHATLESFDPEPDGAALEHCRRWVLRRADPTPTRSLYLFSETPREEDWAERKLQHGNGKTHLAVACLRALLENGALGPGSARFINVPALFYQIRDTFQAQERTWPMLKKLIDLPLLILDDVGAEKVTEWTAEALYLVLDGRLGRPTILTSNYGLRGLKELDPEKWGRICSRIAGECQLIQLRGPDRRLRR